MEIQKKLGSLFGKASGLPPPQLVTGFAMVWQPRMGGNGELEPYVTYNKPGISIGFQTDALTENHLFTFFGDGEFLKIFYEIPEKAGAPIIAASELLVKSDPFFKPSEMNNRLAQGYLNYVAEALNLIYQTDSGGKLINGLLVTKSSILIVIQAAHMGNSYNGGGSTTCVSAANQLIDQLPRNLLNAGLLLDLIKKTSGQSDPALACNWLAARVNGLPLYSLFVQEPQYRDGFLGRFLRFRAAPITGPVIRDWLTNNDAGAFLAFLATDKTKQDGVVLVDYFKSALIMILYGRSVPGDPGRSVTVQFSVGFNPKDENDPTLQRPPAIGLGHELIHAYNVAVGAQPGLEIYHFSTMLTERLCVGLPPFDDIAAIHENALRAEWPPAGARPSVPFDRVAPRPRLVYDAVPEGEVVTTRNGAHTP